MSLPLSLALLQLACVSGLQPGGTAALLKPGATRHTLSLVVPASALPHRLLRVDVPAEDARPQRVRRPPRQAPPSS